MKTEAETEVKDLYVEKCWGLPEAGGRKEGYSPEGFGDNREPEDNLISDI